MNDAPRVSSNTPASLDIKSANLPMVALMLKSTDLGAIEQELARRFGDVPDFFDEDPLLIDLTGAVASARRNGEPEPVVDFAALLQLLGRYKVRPIAVRGGTQTQMQAAHAAGLLLAPDVMLALVLPVAPYDLCDCRPRAIPVGKSKAPQRQSNYHYCMPIIHKPQRKEKMDLHARDVARRTTTATSTRWCQHHVSRHVRSTVQQWRGRSDNNL